MAGEPKVRYREAVQGRGHGGLWEVNVRVRPWRSVVKIVAPLNAGGGQTPPVVDATGP